EDGDRVCVLGMVDGRVDDDQVSDDQPRDEQHQNTDSGGERHSLPPCRRPPHPHRRSLRDARARWRRPRTLDAVPELPEVEALAAFLRERAVGRTVARADAAALSAVKTFDPPLSAVRGAESTAAA